ncbi:unnamed protein product, partial [Rotaria sordida]
MEITVTQNSTALSIFSTSAERQRNSISCECKICGASARYSYYGAIVCHSCKMFFKRNAENKQIPTSSSLESDQSILTLNQWNLIANLVHCFDQHNGYVFVEDFLEEQNRLPVKLRFKYPSVCNFFTSMKRKIQFIFERNVDFLSLSDYDRAILLRTTVEYTSNVASMFILCQYKLCDYPLFYKSTEMIFKSSAAKFTRRIIDQLDPDNTFIKLILSILAFSTTNYTVYKKNMPINLTNIKGILSIQDMYTDLTWRYLLYRYGHHQAV